ncbi:ABC transporter permease [Gracilibacillus caseinilyticus]|uniref:ABC transporter permease n=1 Tax=Gracilibacillus caseinilyticus TaxID=2932256 RepID=A0ABY4EWV0_9BACI|nr:ABC transporter permease [Gracilibacillus caseinilyticus]UOQ48891.1 ABC transporter permease [Gracilibacillus caseinilyticus]
MLFHRLSSLLYLKWRQSWLASFIWTVSLVAVTVVVASAFTELFKSDQERNALSQTMENPAMTAMVGPGYGLDDYTNGAMMAHEMLLFTAIVFAIMSILLITKLTRKEEEEGKFELIRSLPVGRLSSLSSAVILVSALNIFIGAVIAVSLSVGNLDGFSVEGSVLYGFTLAAAGLVFTGVAAVVAQLTETSRSTLGLSIGIMLIAYLVRAIGDVSNETLSRISPLGLILRTEVYVNNYWWPVMFTVLIYIILTLLAFYLHSYRDVGAGLLPSKPGRKEASKLLRSPLGLILRLQRTTIISWLVALLLLGISYGSIFGDIESFFEGNDMLQQLLGDSTEYTMTEQFTTLLMVIMSIFATIPAVISFLKIRGEEKKERNDHLLTTGISRHKLFYYYLGIAIVIGIAGLFIAIYGLWASSVTVMEEPIPLTNLIKAGFSYIPAMLSIIMLATVLYGLLPKWTSLVWAYVVFSFFTVYLGGLMDIPEWLSNLSSFAHIPQIPVEDFAATPLIIITIISIAGIICGQVAYRNRDA